jgi:hypothetical protein
LNRRLQRRMIGQAQILAKPKNRGGSFQRFQPETKAL